MRVLAGVVLLVLVACGGGPGKGAGVDDDEASTTVTVPADGVAIDMQAYWADELLLADITVTNGTDRDSVVVLPTSARRNGGERFVGLLPEVEPGFSDALTTGVAPPSAPALLVERGSSIEVREALARYSEELTTIELCLEVAPAGERVRDLENGDKGSVTYREQGTPARVACSGPVEIADQPPDDPLDEE